MPVLAPIPATGLLASAEVAGVGREAQSTAFLSTPGIDPLYSGVTNRTASASRMAAMSLSAPGIPPPVSSSSVSSNGSTALRSSNVISSTPGGSSSPAARSRLRLCEASRREPAMPSTRMVLVLVVDQREIESHRNGDVLAQHDSTFRQRRVPLQADRLAVNGGLEVDADLLDVAEGHRRPGEAACGCGRCGLALHGQGTLAGQDSVVDGQRRGLIDDLRIALDVEEVGREQVALELLILDLQRVDLD